MEFILKLIFGFIVMLILVVISSIPIFLSCFLCFKFKQGYNKFTAFILFILCCVIYVILQVACAEVGILESRESIPLIPMILIFCISQIGTIFNGE